MLVGQCSTKAVLALYSFVHSQEETGPQLHITLLVISSLDWVLSVCAQTLEVKINVCSELFLYDWTGFLYFTNQRSEELKWSDWSVITGSGGFMWEKKISWSQTESKHTCGVFCHLWCKSYQTCKTLVIWVQQCVCVCVSDWTGGTHTHTDRFTARRKLHLNIYQPEGGNFPPTVYTHTCEYLTWWCVCVSGGACVTSRPLTLLTAVSLVDTHTHINTQTHTSHSAWLAEAPELKTASLSHKKQLLYGPLWHTHTHTPIHSVFKAAFSQPLNCKQQLSLCLRGGDVCVSVCAWWSSEVDDDSRARLTLNRQNKNTENMMILSLCFDIYHIILETSSVYCRTGGLVWYCMIPSVFVQLYWRQQRAQLVSFCHCSVF